MRHVFSSKLLQPSVKKLRAHTSDLILDEAELHDAIVFLLNGLQQVGQALITDLVLVKLDRSEDRLNIPA